MSLSRTRKLLIETTSPRETSPNSGRFWRKMAGGNSGRNSSGRSKSTSNRCSRGNILICTAGKTCPPCVWVMCGLLLLRTLGRDAFGRLDVCHRVQRRRALGGLCFRRLGRLRIGIHRLHGQEKAADEQDSHGPKHLPRSRHEKLLVSELGHE